MPSAPTTYRAVIVCAPSLDTTEASTPVGGRGFAYNTRTDTGVAVGKNNVYAGKDGNVYRYNQSAGLQQHTSDGWSLVSHPADAHSGC